MMNDPETNHEVRLTVLEQAIEAIKQNTDRIVEFAQAMTRLDERHMNITEAVGRAFRAIEREEKERTQQIAACEKEIAQRLLLIEREMPTLTMARNWLFGFVIWALGMTGGMAWLIIFK